VAKRDDLIAFLDELLESESFEDYGPNGLQVPGSAEVQLVATGVSAHQELFEQAAAAGAQMVLCHHGIFWGPGFGPITPQMKERLRLLFDSDMSLAAYHLPLDAHAEVGNNALICAGLGLERAEPFGDSKGRPVGWVGAATEPLTSAELLSRCKALFEREPLAFEFGPDEIRRVGIVSGGADSMVSDAIELGLDAFITGEVSEPVMADAREGGIHFISAGHYATETFGVKKLGELLSERFGVEHRWIEVPNPV
jgi:dinuclear metal center YbgI/SA1388 family protein